MKVSVKKESKVKLVETLYIFEAKSGSELGSRQNSCRGLFRLFKTKFSFQINLSKSKAN
jgi:hypothetical protein